MNCLATLCVILAAFVTVNDASALRFKAFEGLVNKMTQGVKEAQKTVSVDGKPSFCRKLSCPSFKVVKKTEDYEERKYGTDNWVTTNTTGVSLDTVQYTLFMRLFRYIQGNNMKRQKIDMTVPVKMKVVPGQGPACKTTFIMSFYLAPSVGKGPKPSDPTVYLTTSAPATVFVKSFGGFAKSGDWPEEVKELSEVLKDKGFAKDYYYTAGYDSPFTFFHRHNEVWLVSE